MKTPSLPLREEKKASTIPPLRAEALCWREKRRSEANTSAEFWEAGPRVTEARDWTGQLTSKRFHLKA